MHDELSFLDWIFLIVVSANGFAQEQVNSKADKYVSFFSSERFNNTAKNVVSGAGSVASETQAIFLMAGLAAVEGMKQQVTLSGIKKENITAEQLATISKKSAAELIQRSDTWAGVSGMLATNAALKKPLDLWQTVVQSTSTRPLLKELISGASANLVGFAGFEAGSELWNRAQMMLPNEADRKRASKMWPALGSAIFGKDKDRSNEDKALLGQVMNNMYTILVKDDDLREKWWSFVMRNRIETGNFLVGVSMMTTGATLGNRVGSCVPNPLKKIAMPAIGAAFGLASGIGASFVPTETKDSITRGIQYVRIEKAEKEMKQTEMDIATSVGSSKVDKAVLRGIGLKNSKIYQIDSDYMGKRIDTELSKLQEIREGMMTSIFDKVHLINSRLYAINNKIELAREYQNSDAVTNLSKERDSLLLLYKDEEKNVADKLGRQLGFFTKMRSTVNDPELTEKLDREIENLKSMSKWTSKFMTQVRETSSWGKNSKTNSENLMSEQENQKLLEKFYLWGFKQEPFLETMEFNN